MSAFHKVAESKDLAPGRGMVFDVAGKRIAVFNVDGTYSAIGDTCTHRGGPLSEGDLVGSTVTCPLHGAQFDVRTGEVLGPPAPTGVPSYKVRVEGSEIQVEIP